MGKTLRPFPPWGQQPPISLSISEANCMCNRSLFEAPKAKRTYVQEHASSPPKKKLPKQAHKERGYAKLAQWRTRKRCTKLVSL